MKLNSKLWLLWIVLTISGGAVLIASMLYGGLVRPQLLIGRTTDGHHQIELACDACHTDAFGGEAALQKSCIGCHGADLKSAEDSHPARLFRDPRNADQLEQVNAVMCVACHREHKPELTRAMGVTIPADNCVLCHMDEEKDRPSHKNLAFNGCAAAGCHNYHDNRALFEDFLAKHLGEPDQLPVQLVALRAWTNAADAGTAEKRKPLAREDADGPAEKRRDVKIMLDWLATAHAKEGVNCSGCHEPKTAPGARTAWRDKPGREVCASCHRAQAATFLEGKHGMRLRPGMNETNAGLFGLLREKPLSPMSPALGRLPMNPKVRDTEIGCTTCHGAHAFDRVKAQIEGCLACHADEHSKAYLGGPHHKLWLAERTGEEPAGSGVSCATCHMPRVKAQDERGRQQVIVTHNQNDNLRPNEKMVRSVCADCHGMQFTLDALADTVLTGRNFSGRPTGRVESLDWAARRVAKDKVPAR